jgi:transposase
MLGVALSVGRASNLEGEMADALVLAVAQATESVQAADRVHADETGWVEGREDGRGKRAWLWRVATALVAVFRIAPSRGGKVARALLLGRTSRASSSATGGAGTSGTTTACDNSAGPT